MPMPIAGYMTEELKYSKRALLVKSKHAVFQKIPSVAHCNLVYTGLDTGSMVNWYGMVY